MKGKDCEVYAPFCTFAILTPVVNGAVGKNWLPTLIAGLAICLLCCWRGEESCRLPTWIRIARIVALAFLTSTFLKEIHQSWPGHGAQYVVPLVLLILAGYSVWKGNAARGVNVLRFGVYVIFGALLLLGIGEVQIKELMPKAEYPDVRLVAALLLLMIGRRTGKKGSLLLTGAALAAALVTSGTKTSDLYGFSRGLSIDGVTEHIESLAACALTAGYYALLVFLVDAAVTEQTCIKVKRCSWFLPVYGGTVYAIYLVMTESPLELLVFSELLLWGLVPLIWHRKEKCKKVKKGVDKTRKGW